MIGQRLKNQKLSAFGEAYRAVLPWAWVLLIGGAVIADLYLICQKPKEAKAEENVIHPCYLDEATQIIIRDCEENFVREFGEECRISTELLYAICEAESMGDKDAVSYDGQHYGLFQCADHHKWRLETIFPECGEVNLFDPVQNTYIAIHYLNELRWDYAEGEEGADVALVLALYHGESQALTEGYSSAYAQQILTRATELEALRDGRG